MNWAAYMWLALMVGFVIAEAACPFHLVSIWFAVGSLASMVAAVLGAQFWLQITLFLVVSVGLLVATLPLVKKFVIPKQEKTNVESLIGKKGIVIEDISNIHATGQVAVSGSEWTARSVSDGITIEKGEVVVIREISGVKAIVEKEV